MIRTPLQARAKAVQHGYKVEPFGDRGWVLLDPDGANLMIGNYGQVSPTEWEAYAEALHRIEQDEPWVTKAVPEPIVRQARRALLDHPELADDPRVKPLLDLLFAVDTGEEQTS